QRRKDAKFGTKSRPRSGFMTKALACREMKLPSPQPSPSGLGKGRVFDPANLLLYPRPLCGRGKGEGQLGRAQFDEAHEACPEYGRRGHEEKRSRAKHAKIAREKISI